MPSKKVYSCSRPNQVSCLAYFSAISRQPARVFVGCGSPLTRKTSHITSLLLPPRIGSSQTKTGLRTQFERTPVGYRGLEPSNPQVSGSFPVGRIFALDRSLAVGSVPSTQMFSAL